MSYVPSAALTAAGVQLGYIALKDTNSRYITGRSRTAPAVGAVGSGCFRLWGIKEVGVAVPETDSVVIDGDDVRITEFEFDAIGSRKFTAMMSVWDMEMAAAFLDAIVVTRGGTNMLARSSANVPHYAATAIFNGRAQNYPANAPNWYTDMLPNCTVTILGRSAMAGRTAADFRVSITMLPTNYDNLGISLSVATNGVTNADVLQFSGPNPLTMHRHTGDNTTVAFQVDEKPIGTAFTLGTVNGAVVSIASVNSTTLPYTITYSAAPPTNAVVITQYQFDGSDL